MDPADGRLTDDEVDDVCIPHMSDTSHVIHITCDLDWVAWHKGCAWQVIRHADIDGDGQINYEEWIKYGCAEKGP